MHDDAGCHIGTIRQKIFTNSINQPHHHHHHCTCGVMNVYLCYSRSKSDTPETEESLLNYNFLRHLYSLPILADLGSGYLSETVKMPFPIIIAAATITPTTTTTTTTIFIIIIITSSSINNNLCAMS
uniref:Uncharacterized protein n=1 Tax=Anopheles farauti TaxID=69004 RepID=A0A182Q827_9DIPT